MPLTISESDRRLVLSSQDALVLGIITHGETVRLAVADARLRPGHVEWLRRDGIPPEEVTGGFSLLVRHGQVAGLFPASRLNPGPDGLLNAEDIEALRRLFPLAQEFRVYRY